MTDLYLIVNPDAGRGAAARVLPGVLRELRAAGLEVDLYRSQRPGDIEVQVGAAVAAGRERIVVAGGDGSFHEAVNGLLAAGGKRIGLLPLGTGNDFAKSAGIPADAVDAAASLAQRVRRGETLGDVDAGHCNGRYFHNGAGIGLDARVARVAASVRLPIGRLVYGWGIIRCLVDGVATPSVSICADGERVWQGPVTLANVANGRWVGGAFLIAPAADPRDGRLDLVIADVVTRRRALSLLPRLRSGRHLGAPEVTSRTVRSLRIECDGPVVAHLDGEVQPSAEAFDIHCLERALRLL